MKFIIKVIWVNWWSERNERNQRTNAGWPAKQTQLLQQFHQMKGSTLPPSFDWSCWGAYRAAASSLAPRSIHSNSIRFLYFIENEMKGPLQLNWMNFTLSSMVDSWIDWFLFSFSSLWRSRAALPPLTHQMKGKQNQSLHSSTERLCLQRSMKTNQLNHLLSLSQLPSINNKEKKDNWMSAGAEHKKKRMSKGAEMKLIYLINGMKCCRGRGASGP